MSILRKLVKACKYCKNEQIPILEKNLRTTTEQPTLLVGFFGIVEYSYYLFVEIKLLFRRFIL
jgi:hypothetical protein